MICVRAAQGKVRCSEKGKYEYVQKILQLCCKFFCVKTKDTFCRFDKKAVFYENRGECE